MLDDGTADGLQWLSGPKVIEFIALDDGHPIVCRVSQKSQEHNRHCRPVAATLLGAARDNFGHIADCIGRLMQVGRFEPDGTILLRSSDWREFKLLAFIYAKGHDR